MPLDQPSSALTRRMSASPVRAGCLRNNPGTDKLVFKINILVEYSHQGDDISSSMQQLLLLLLLRRHTYAYSIMVTGVSGHVVRPAT